jgi:hypothetical protein
VSLWTMRSISCANRRGDLYGSSSTAPLAGKFTTKRTSQGKPHCDLLFESGWV